MCAADPFPDVVFAFISACPHITIIHEVWIDLGVMESFKRMEPTVTALAFSC
jgi:hypothetical protein